MPPILYLVRHADANDAAKDAVRTLSARGRQQVAKLAALLRPSRAFHPAEVWHSPLVRAKQTAELLVTELSLKVRWQEKEELEPEADPDRTVALLKAMEEPLAVFGHQPHMSALASLLVSGEAEPAVFAFRKAAVLALEPSTKHRWAVRWMLSPDLFE